MKIHLYGNVLNWAYQFGTYLRTLGHDVRVFVDARETSPLYQPAWEHGESRELPDWIETVDVRFNRLLWPGAREREFLKKLGECDLIQTFGEYAVWAWRSGAPYVVLSYGGDLEILPFAKGNLKERVLGGLVTHALRRAQAFVYAIPSHHGLVRQLKIKQATFNPHAVPIDTSRWMPAPEEDRCRLRARYSQHRVFFHGARQEWTFKDANDKGNDRLFRAFARFVRNDCPDSLLIAVERGRDLAHSKALVAELKLSQNVVWSKALTKPDLLTMLNSVDGFFDQFIHGYFGVASLEALSCGVPTFLKLRRDGTDGVVLPPVLNVSTEDEIHRAMCEVDQAERMRSLRGASRKWAVTYHDWRVVMNWYVGVYRDVLAGRGGAEC